MNSAVSQFIVGLSIGTFAVTFIVNARSAYFHRYSFYKSKDMGLLCISFAGSLMGYHLISKKYLSPLYVSLPEVPFWVLAYFTSSVGCLVGTIRND
jgi:hypothetical protein